MTAPETSVPLNPGQQLLVEMAVAMGTLATEIRLLREVIKQDTKSRQVMASINDSIAARLDTLDLTMEILYDNKRGGSLSFSDFTEFYAEAAAQVEKENSEEEEEEEDPDKDP